MRNAVLSVFHRLFVHPAKCSSFGTVSIVATWTWPVEACLVPLLKVNSMHQVGQQRSHCKDRRVGAARRGNAAARIEPILMNSPD